MVKQLPPRWYRPKIDDSHSCFISTHKYRPHPEKRGRSSFLRLNAQETQRTSFGRKNILDSKRTTSYKYPVVGNNLS
ncbi:hypothetical protein L1987_38592 [Smallanthus sonchifolius]|uniref:Uncharacterized protein n=1 Tax=Smallanthus sonchifolius TaxID=185202 RepID=A0ACB9HKV5_9ASTR|nr:hypothetical protein L1987_38592 [Smallanthus sonchifolius]